MRYRGSEAFDLDMDRAQTAREPGGQRSLTVVEGGHLDEDVRRGVSPRFLHWARVVVVAVAIVCALGAVRVALTAATVALTSGNATLVEQVKEARDLNGDLKAERSLLSSGSRIMRIATQVYGMVYNPATTSVDVSGGSVDAAQDAD